jgi:hypothetical protein
MGLSIHYNGAIREKHLLPEMIVEIKEIADHYNWEYRVFEERFPDTEFNAHDPDQDIYGIIVSPPNSESLYFSFLSNGRLGSPSSVKFWANHEDPEYRKFIYRLSTKTQFAGAEIHQKIILLFKHINTKYLKDFKMIDESEYWETGDEKLMLLNFEKYTTLIENLSMALESIETNDNENMEEYLKRVFNRVSEDFKQRFGN